MGQRVRCRLAAESCGSLGAASKTKIKFGCFGRCARLARIQFLLKDEHGRIEES